MNELLTELNFKEYSIIEYYDSPQIFTVLNKKGQYYFVLIVNDSPPVISYIYTKITEAALELLRVCAYSYQDIVTHPAAKSYFVTHNLETDKVEVRDSSYLYMLQVLGDLPVYANSITNVSELEKNEQAFCSNCGSNCGCNS